MRHLERSGSRSGSDATGRNSTAELTWTVWGSYRLEDCLDYLAHEGVVPGLFRGLIFDEISWEHQGAGTWYFTASYKDPDRADEEEKLETGDYEFSFDTGGQKVTRKTSLGTKAYAKPGETAPNFKNAIGVTKDKSGTKVEGVEVGIPALSFSIRKRQPRSIITLEYIRLIKSLTYCKNAYSYLGFDPGELLFIGATGQQGTSSDPEVTYKFIASDNMNYLTAGDTTGIVKAGHDYLWVFFEEVDDETAEMTVKQPKAAYVEQVYYSRDLSDLNI